MTIHITTKRYDIKIETVADRIPKDLSELITASDRTEARARTLEALLKTWDNVERVTVEDYLPFPKSIS